MGEEDIMVQTVTPSETQQEPIKQDEKENKPAIGTQEIREAVSILQKYKSGKANLERKIIDNEQWYKLRHWQQIGMPHTDTDPYPTSAWLFNSIANKHADAMDNAPEPAILPREEGDKQEAETLTSILPVVFEQNDFEETYSDVWWYKLKHGTGVYGVFWSNSKLNGLGDIDIKPIDILNLFWEPGIKDIQDSRNMFNVELIDNDILRDQYPQYKDNATPSIDIAKYVYDDTVDTSDKSTVIDWYYKKSQGGRNVLHYCKFVNDTVLYASENDPEYKDRGYYDHGKYPFVFDTLFLMAGTPAGFGYIDTMKSPQLYIDKLDQLIIKNALQSSKKRFFVRDDGSVNEEEFADWDKDFVHVTGTNMGEESIREIQTSPIAGIYVQIKQLKVDELKETSGNRDFSQGGTSSGVTSGAAIAALQEAGSKLSRDMIKASYRAYAQICWFAIELIRQFYSEPRYFRILGMNGTTQFINYDNRGLMPQNQGMAFGEDMGYRLPEFDIKIKAQKASAFSKVAQNELAKELYGMGFFNPQLADQALVCIDMMDFEGKNQLMQKISENNTLYQQMQMMQAQMAKMAAIIDNANGTNLSAMMGGGVPVGIAPGGSGQTVDTNSLGAEAADRPTVANAREQIRNTSNPK